MKQVFLSIALLLGASAEEKKEETKAVEEAKTVEASKKQDKRGIFDHDFGGHDFGGHDFGSSSHASFSSHDFGSHGHEIHHHEHHEPIVHEKTLTVVKKIPVPGKTD